jgi:hypothetical protein
VGPFSKPSIPPVTAEYATALQTAGAASAPQQSAYRLFRASDGKTRVDTGNMSVIHDPAAGKTIVLDHLKKQAQITPAVPQAPSLGGLPPMQQVPGMPAIPGAPQMPAVQVQDLGKTFMQGQQVEGKRYTIAPPALPKPPQMPGMPTPPQAPGMPQVPGGAGALPKLPKIPGMPSTPPKPPMPSTAEVWTSPQLQLPMASKINGGFGQQTSICQKATPGEPHPAVFQIPQDYKQLLPKPPKLPSAPKLPGM